MQRKHKQTAVKRSPAGGRRPLRKRLASCLLVCLIGGLLLGGLVFLVDRRVEKQGRAGTLTFEQLAGQAAYDCVIVPGALVYRDGTPSTMLRDRLDMAVRIYQSGITGRILVSGDHGRTEYDEVNTMRLYLLAAGIPAESIFMDHAGFDTYDTLYRAQAVFQVRRALITTQDFHLYRAVYIGRQLGLDIQGLTSAYSVTTRKQWYRFREYPARFKAFLDCEILHTKPTFVGPVIPVSGDGRQTSD